MIIYKPEGSRFEGIDISGFRPVAFKGFEGALVITSGTALFGVYDSEHYTVRQAAVDFIEELQQAVVVDDDDDPDDEDGATYYDDYIVWSVNQDPSGDDMPNLVVMAIIRLEMSPGGKLAPYFIGMPDDRSDPRWDRFDPSLN